MVKCRLIEVCGENRAWRGCGARRSRAVDLACAVFGLCATGAMALQQTATVYWEGSSDGGATWHAGSIVVPQDQPEVMVRSWVSWTGADSTTAFSGTLFDGVVRNVGPGDAIVDIGVHRLPVIATNYVASRFGSIIKVDQPADTLPPGLGAGWLNPQNWPSHVFFNSQMPFPLAQFTLVLDGTAGTRQVGQVFRVPPGQPPNGVVGILTNSGLTFSILPTTAIDLDITVVPAPGAIALLVLGGVVAARRRRRR